MVNVGFATLDIIPSMRGIQQKLTSGMTGPSGVAGATAGAEAGKKFGSSMTNRVKSFIGPMAALAAGAAVLQFGKDAFAEAQEAAKIGALTEAVIRSTGGAAQITADQVGSLAESISNKVGIDDEAIQSGANLLLTFKNIRNELGAGNDIFDQATQAATDMSAAMGTDMKSAALQVGKALNDPIAGLTALSRAGVQFTDQQKEQIKALVESGDTMAAQKIILGELESQFGGAAEAMATPADKAKVAWANFQELIGTAVMPLVNKLFVGFAKGVTILSRVGKFVADNSTAFKFLAGVVGALTAITLANNAAMSVAAAGGLAQWIAQTRLAGMVTKVWTAVQAAFNLIMSANPIVLVGLALVALVAGLVLAWKHSETFRKIVTSAWTAVKGVVLPIVDWFKTAIPAAWELIQKVTSVVFDVIGAYFKFWFDLLRGIFTGNLDLIKSTLSGAWDAMKVIISTAWEGIKSLISSALETVKTWISNAWTAVQTATSLAWGGIKSAVSTKVGELIEFVRGIPGRIISALGNVGGMLVDAGQSIIQGLIDGIRDMIGGVGDVMGDIVGKIADFLPGSPVKTGPLKVLNRGYAGGQIARMLADGMLSEQALLSRAAGQLAGSAVVGGAGGRGGRLFDQGGMSLGRAGRTLATIDDHTLDRLERMLDRKEASLIGSVTLVTQPGETQTRSLKNVHDMASALAGIPR